MSDERVDRGSKRPCVEVHSANKWEKADLGDEERKQKFLRLMGGAKKDPKSQAAADSTSIDHSRSHEDVQKAEEELESQFLLGVEMKFKNKRHTGLGFTEEAPPPPPDSSSDGHHSAPHPDDPQPEVHSANKWEEADLGDTDRNKKFLRLMGASKKEHHGRLVIGEHSAPHSRSEDAEKKVKHDLESQFRKGAESRWSSQDHKGLRTSEDRYKTVHSSSEGHPSSSSDSSTTGSKSAYKGLNFVKASSSS